jgi:hypothetical protein
MFAVYDSAAAGNAVAGPITNRAVSVNNGLFTTTIDFGSAAFNGSSRWLDISVRTNGSSTFFTLSPRQAFTPTPYSITAATITGPVPASQLVGTIPSSAVSGTYNSQLTLNNANNQFAGSYSGNGAGVTNVNAATLNGLASSNFWQTGGNNVTSGQFIGSTNNQSVEIRANNKAALVLTAGANDAPNIEGGAAVNVIDPGVQGAVIAGGGTTNFLGQMSSNRISADFAAISGGSGNWIQLGADHSIIGAGWNNAILNAYQSVIAGGQQNAISNANYAFIGGGIQNVVSSTYSAVMGGNLNLAGGSFAFVGGGYANQALGGYSTISGGYSNRTAAQLATVPGGYYNVASGFASFAAGYYANATNSGTFVWADSDGGAFNSTAANQFLVRAQGGVGINTNNPNGSALNVLGNVNATSFSGSGANLTGLNASQLSSGSIPSAQLAGTYSSALTLNNSGNTFTGNGAGLTSLNAGNISAGTLSDARLSSNVPLLNGTQTFSGRDSFTQGIGIGTTSGLEGNVNINTNTYLYSHSLYLRGETGTDHNHGLAYSGNTITNFGNGNAQVDGPVLWGYGGGALGVMNSGAHPVLTWNSTGINVPGTATIGGNLSANNTPGVNWNQNNNDNINITLAPGGTTVGLGTEGNLKPAPGFFVIIGTASCSQYGSGDFTGYHLQLWDVTGTPVQLTESQAWMDDYDGGPSMTVSWVVPITSAGGYQNFGLELYINGTAGDKIIINSHNLTVMYFPRQNN